MYVCMYLYRHIVRTCIDINTHIHAQTNKHIHTQNHRKLRSTASQVKHGRETGCAGTTVEPQRDCCLGGGWAQEHK